MNQLRMRHGRQFGREANSNSSAPDRLQLDEFLGENDYFCSFPSTGKHTVFRPRRNPRRRPMRPTRARGVRARAQKHLPACASPLTRNGVSCIGDVVDPAHEDTLINTCVACAGRSCEAFGCTCRSAEGKSGKRRSFQSSTFFVLFLESFFFQSDTFSRCAVFSSLCD